MQIVERIKMKCKQKGTTMGTLEREFGFGNGTIRRWDERMPSADKMLIIAKRLDVTVEWILTGKEVEELTPDEKQLVDYYRNTNSIGQKSTMSTAKTNSELMPAELESSTSGIG